MMRAVVQEFEANDLPPPHRSLLCAERYREQSARQSANDVFEPPRLSFILS